MNAFIKKSLHRREGSCGSLLRARREGMGVSVEEASLSTGVPVGHIKRLEEDAYHELPGDWYVKKYIRVYAHYLGLSPEEVLARYDPPRPASVASFSPMLRLREILPSSRLTVWPKRVTRTSLGFGLVLFLSILAVRMTAQLSPPMLAVTYPPEGYITHMDTLVLSGRSEPEARIVVNGESLVPGKDGTFSLMVHLTYGVNVYTITAQRRFGKQAQISRQIVKDGIAQNPAPSSLTP